MPLRSHMYSRALDRREASELHRGSRHTSQRAQHGGSKLDRAGMAESSFSKARMTHSTNVLYSTTHSSSMSPYTRMSSYTHTRRMCTISCVVGCGRRRQKRAPARRARAATARRRRSA
eukprot:1668956-Pyramimonas_sp.AAC.1